ncbi:MAG: RNA polymerase sigma factor [Acidimicrobiales bacterium]|nr:RNA polymerase sigma factor [Acidimicrobiales bacterium]
MASSDPFDALFNSTYPQVVAYARRRTANAQDADDVVAEIYATAWRRRDQLNSIQTPLAWLYGIGLNVVRNLRRGDRRHLRLVGAAQSQAAAATHASDPADAIQIRDALATIPDDDAELLRLVAWEGLSHSEAGDVLGCSANAIGIRLHRARQRLDAALSPTSNPPHQNKASNQ